MEYTIVTICGLVTLFGLAITLRCILAQKRIHWLSPSSKPVHNASKIRVYPNFPNDLALEMITFFDLCRESGQRSGHISFYEALE